MVGAALFFSLMSLFVKLAGERLPTMEVVAARGAITVVFSILMLKSARVSPWGTGDRGLLVLRGVIGFIALLCFYVAVVRLPLAEATVIHFTSPLFTTVLAALFIGEALHRGELAWAALGFAGVLMVVRPDFGLGFGDGRLDGVAIAIGLVGAVFSAVAYVTVRRLNHTQHHLVIIFYYAVATLLGSLPAFPSFVWPRGGEWLVLLGVGVTTQLGQVFLTKALRRGRAGPTMSVGYLQIPLAALWGYFFFTDLPDRWTILGTAVIVTSTLLLARRRSV